MDNAPEPMPETVTAHLGLSIAGRTVRADITIPTKPVRIGEMLPVFQSLSELVVGATVEAVEAGGCLISCQKGCGACCRQLVPISEVEARRIRDLVEALPEPRRSTVRARFAAAARQLEEAGLLEKLRHPEQWDNDALCPVGLDYFAQRIACPFLEDESCSIHVDRPIACREYLVTSPAVYCQKPSAETIERVKMPTSVWNAVARLDPVAPSSRFIRWVPLILAPEWADANPEEAPPRPAPDLLRAVLEQLTGNDVGPPKPPATPTTSNT
jgi:Fe-S-cluster containining protein